MDSDVTVFCGVNKRALIDITHNYVHGNYCSPIYQNTINRVRLALVNHRIVIRCRYRQNAQYGMRHIRHASDNDHVNWLERVVAIAGSNIIVTTQQEVSL